MLQGTSTSDRLPGAPHGSVWLPRPCPRRVSRLAPVPSQAVCGGWNRVNGSQTFLSSLRIRNKAGKCRAVLVQGRTSPYSGSPREQWGAPPPFFGAGPAHFLISTVGQTVRVRNLITVRESAPEPGLHPRHPHTQSWGRDPCTECTDHLGGDGGAGHPLLASVWPS